ncbi:MAG: MauE/DoxX family redox-associated membrane protein [Bacteroidota bacterium]
MKLSFSLYHTVRIFVGAVFILSSIGKFIDSSDAQYLVELLSMNIYWLIEYKAPIVLSITILELILGILLIWNHYILWAYAAALLLILSLSSVLLFFMIQGTQVAACGCFGAFDLLSGPNATLAKNGVLVLLLVYAWYSYAKSIRK